MRRGTKDEAQTEASRAPIGSIDPHIAAGATSIETAPARLSNVSNTRFMRVFFINHAINTPITREISERNVTRCRALFQVVIDRASTDAAFIYIAMCDRLKLSEQRSGVST